MAGWAGTEVSEGGPGEGDQCWGRRRAQEKVKGEFTIHWQCLNKDRKTREGRRTGPEDEECWRVIWKWVFLSFQKRFQSSDLLVTGSWRKQHYFSPTKSLSTFQQRPTCNNVNSDWHSSEPKSSARRAEEREAKDKTELINSDFTLRAKPFKRFSIYFSFIPFHFSVAHTDRPTDPVLFFNTKQSVVEEVESNMVWNYLEPLSIMLATQ